MSWIGKTVLALAAFAIPTTVGMPASAAGPRQEYWEGQREIARERAEMRRDILNSKSRKEAERAYREGMREINREKREMRREIRRAVHRRYIGRVIAGIVLGEIIGVPIAGRPPVRPPRPDLCWYWSNRGRTNGYWYYCRNDY